MTAVLVVVAWVAIGVAAGLADARRGHWSRSWLLGGVLGPLFVPYAIAGRRRERDAEIRTVREGAPAGGGLDVLVGVDGSNGSLDALRAATHLFGDGIGRLTLATVLDFDTAGSARDGVLAPEAWPEETAADSTLRDAVAAATDDLGFEPEAVVLAGRPGDALASFARTRDVDVVVVGRRGRGWSTALLGSCASRLTATADRPVVVIPGPVTGTAAAARDDEGVEPLR